MTTRVVFDTNILISALLSPTGAPFRCVALAKTGIVQSVTCAEILDEFAEKLQSKCGDKHLKAVASYQSVKVLSAQEFLLLVL